jgi:hypothetical protein
MTSLHDFTLLASDTDPAYLHVKRQILIKKGRIFWDVTLCTIVEVYRRFETTDYLHLEDQRVSHARNSKQSTKRANDHHSQQHCQAITYLFIG